MAVGKHRGNGVEVLKWNAGDTCWATTLFGTAVGAGILYLPITASLGGMWALVAMTLLIYPMTFLSHRGLCRVVLAADRVDGDITEAVEAARQVGVAISAEIEGRAEVRRLAEDG